MELKFVVLTQGYEHNPMLYHGLVAQNLATQKHAPAVALLHYVDDVILTSDFLTDIENTCESSGEAPSGWGWAVNEAKVQGPGLSANLGELSGQVKPMLCWRLS